jgi:hypothetical protein
MKTIPLFDALISEAGARTDAGIARLTRTDHSTITRIRHGQASISESFCFRVALGTGWSAKRVYDLVNMSEAA